MKNTSWQSIEIKLKHQHVHHNVIHILMPDVSKEFHIQFHFAARFQCTIPAFQGRKFGDIAFISWWRSWRYLWILLYQGSTDVWAKHVKAIIHQAKSRIFVAPWYTGPYTSPYTVFLGSLDHPVICLQYWWLPPQKITTSVTFAVDPVCALYL